MRQKIRRGFIKRFIAEYKLKPLSLGTMDRDPIRQFDRWFKLASKHCAHEPNAFILATAAKNGLPSARVMLLKSFDRHGFTFFTNYLSRKGREIRSNNVVAMVFFWPEMMRQVRLIGKVRRLPASVSDQYFEERPHGARLGAHASAQSSVIKGREELRAALAKLAKNYQGKKIPRPRHWGGFIVVPSEIEFWQGQPNRLHDRFRYRRTKQSWKIERLAP